MPSGKHDIAVLMTTFNRVHTTLDCLSHLMNQTFHPDIRIEVFLADAQSPDDTRTAVEATFPSVKCTTVPGSTFWNQGMIAAYHLTRTATSLDSRDNRWDYYLLLNDDTLLYHDALDVLLKTSETVMAETGRKPLVVGAICDAETEQTTYGGMKKRRALKSLMPGPFHELVPPVGYPQLVDTCNANCLLVPSDVIDDIGFLDPLFSHGYGDTDLGYRATRSSYPLALTGSFVGTCSINPQLGSARDISLPLPRRMKMILGPKGVPLREWFAFTRRHAGLAWPYHLIRPYILAVIGGTVASTFRSSQALFRRLRSGV